MGAHCFTQMSNYVCAFSIYITSIFIHTKIKKKYNNIQQFSLVGKIWEICFCLYKFLHLLNFPT